MRAAHRWGYRGAFRVASSVNVSAISHSVW